jgi:hypothetical protein
MRRMEEEGIVSALDLYRNVMPKADSEYENVESQPSRLLELLLC